jgi:hypothetical protein
MRIYCDTNTLLSNTNNDAVEFSALGHLLDAHRSGKIRMYRSLVDLREVMGTTNIRQREKLLSDYEELQPIPADERVYGFSTQNDQYGGFASVPLVSDVQDEAICARLELRGLDRRDAQHITQAICTGCDVFLTRDRRTIIEPHGTWIEAQFPPLKVRLPSEV